MTFILGQDMPQPSITKICFKITCLKFHSNFPGANELKFYWSTLLTNIVFGTSQAFPVDPIFVKIEVIHFGPSDTGLVTSQRGTPKKKPLQRGALPTNPAPDGGPIWKITLTLWGPNKMAKHFADNIFKYILLNKQVHILISLSLFLRVPLTICQYWVR